MPFKKRCPHCKQVISLPKSKKSQSSPGMMECQHCSSDYRVKNRFVWNIANFIALIPFMLWIQKTEDEMIATLWMPVVTVALCALAFNYLLVPTKDKRVALSMFKNLFSKNRLDDFDQRGKASFFVIITCAHLMMWRKSFSQDQLNYLLKFIVEHTSCNTAEEAAHLVTECMANLQETTTVMDYLQNSTLIWPLEKPYKKYALENIIIFVFLEGDPQNQRLSYVSYIYEDVKLGGPIGFHRLTAKSYEQYLNKKGDTDIEGFSEAEEIILDALSRTDYQ